MSNQITPNPSVPSQVVQEVKFPKFVNNLGIIPTSYKDSMSYYECLAWLCKYLEETVIPTLNQNGNAVQELQGLYIQLNDYVTNYFENLDVQEEINNKLDEMVNNGELQSILHELNENTIIYLNQELNKINSKVNVLGTATPSVVSSTDEMTDITKIYVLSSSGHWYYYNGSNFVDGGTYQATSISNGSVDILSLDDLLQSNFNLSFSDDLDLGNSVSGYCYNNSGVVGVQTSNNYIYYKVALDVGQVYIFNGGNSQSMCALLVADSSDNIIYNTNVPVASGPNEGTSLLFRVNSSNCYAYISKFLNGSTYLNKTGVRLRKLNNVSNNLKIDSNVNLIDTISDSYSGHTIDSVIRINSQNGYTIYVYSYEKGKKYHITSYNHYSVAGIVLADSNCKCTYASSSSSVSSPTSCEYTFTATDNGYILISIETGYEYSIEQIIDAIDVNLLKTKFYGKKIGADGDSISAGVSNNYSYVTQIANSNNCQLQNLSVGGGTIASGTYESETPRHWICESVENLDSNCDIILLSGGVNDYWNKVPMGSITENYTDEVDTTTFYGGLEKMCRTVLDKFKIQKIAFVTYHKINNIYNTYNSSTGERHIFKDYLDAIYEVMNKYSIPVIDINAKGRFNTGIDYYKNNYTNNSDGVHPTTNGYLYFYNSIVENELNNLL